ncbi:unnamed protein product, partial [Tilletia caries]
MARTRIPETREGGSSSTRVRCPAARCAGKPAPLHLGTHINRVHSRRDPLPISQALALGYKVCAQCDKYVLTRQQSHHCAANQRRTEGNGRHLRSQTSSIGTWTSQVQPTQENSVQAAPGRPPSHQDQPQDDDSDSEYHDAEDAEDDAPAALKARFVKLVQLPGIDTCIPISAVKEWIALTRRLAEAYLADPTSEEALFNILSAPKRLFSPWHDKRAPVSTLTARIRVFPDTPWPKDPALVTRAPRPLAHVAERVHSQVKKGFLSKAAKLLAEGSTIAPKNQATMDALRALNPPGPLNPFPLEGGAPQLSALAKEDDEIRAAVRKIARDTSGGPSGWTQPLLALAMRTADFCAFTRKLAQQIAMGTAPGRDMLCAAVITPLNKAKGGIRPIAVGDLFFRLCGKLVLAAARTDKALLPVQLGVGSRGGCEPLTRLGERIVSGEITHFSTFTFLDARNAYGIMCRRRIATAVKDFCPDLYRAAKWKYNEPSQLFVIGNDGVEIIQSSQGLHQGCPFSALFFSAAARPFLVDLQKELGEGALVTGYIDDIPIFSQEPGTLKKVIDFMEAARADGIDYGIQLNEGKCVEKTVDEVRTEGLEMLGTMLGGTEARRTFLTTKIDQQQKILSNLQLLLGQDAYLLLRLCTQHNLRHLLRILPSEDLQELWARHDFNLRQQLQIIRGINQFEGRHDQDLFALPLTLGGFGVPRFQDIQPHARGAMTEATDEMI